VPSAARQVLHKRGFAAACWALSNERAALSQSNVSKRGMPQSACCSNSMGSIRDIKEATHSKTWWHFQFEECFCIIATGKTEASERAKGSPAIKSGACAATPLEPA